MRTLSKHSISFEFFLFAWLLLGCSKEQKRVAQKPLFTEVEAGHSRLEFTNTVEDSETLNYHNFPYIYMGGGVAIFDADNDGLSDIYLTGNMLTNTLYHNKGNMVFDDISVEAGVQGDERWYTGITIVDINHDGYMDIYVSVSGKNQTTKNQLFVNNGDLTFKEEAQKYGIADSGNSIQSIFFDYDRDGDLDLFVANYPLVSLTQGNQFYHTMMLKNEPIHSGHLYRNDDLVFIDVTKKAGLQNFGLTLGISCADFNNDGWQDIYLSNDFNVPDYFYLNNGDGSFDEVLKETFGHTSMFGMGIDAADFNNDGLSDLVQADMTPEDYKRSKINMASMRPESFREAVNLGFHYQYMQNSLQLNYGTSMNGVPKMGEISRLAGIATTDWSWSTLFADFDNDGWKDLYITNGMKRDVNDNDINDRSGATTFKEAFQTVNIDAYPSEPLENYVFRNKGDLTFEKITKDWGLNYKGFSNGMAYGDLDNDGDLDLVINNLDSKMSLFKNESDLKDAHYLRVKLQGPKKNPSAFGAKLFLENTRSKERQLFDLNPTRGFQSFMEPIAHFGLPNVTDEQVLHIIWPDGKKQSKRITAFDKTLMLDYKDATNISADVSSRALTFNNIAKAAGIEFKHKEDSFDDFRNELLLPHRYSTMGPGLTVGDINHDGLDDFFVGNAAGQESSVYIQKADKTFEILPGPWQNDNKQEDTGALFFDADNDGDIDLYVVSGGHNPNQSFSYYQDRLYINTSQGFVKSEKALPTMGTAGKAVSAFDYDKDGDLDLFVAGRNVPGNYPQVPNSYLLENAGGLDETIRFKKVAGQGNEIYNKMGMVTDSECVDLNQDGWMDLVVMGEWMPIKILINNKGVLKDNSEAWKTTEKIGWWYGLSALDVDNDGDQDLVAGNLGLNYKYKASIEKPFEVFAGDFDKNNRIDIVLGQHKEGRLLPLRGRECSSQQIPAIKQKFKSYREFANADMYDIYGRSELEKATHFKANTFAHYWLENTGDTGFKWHQLPNRSQISPINSILPFDYNQDGYTDLLVSGNLYDSEVETPRADAGVGLILQNDTGKGFIPVDPNISGLIVPGNLSRSATLDLGQEQHFLFTGSNEPVSLIKFKKPG